MRSHRPLWNSFALGFMQLPLGTAAAVSAKGFSNIWQAIIVLWRISDIRTGCREAKLVIASDPPSLIQRATAGMSPPKRRARRRKRSNPEDSEFANLDCFVAIAPRNDDASK
jgi:hypothetical protein